MCYKFWAFYENFIFIFFQLFTTETFFGSFFSFFSARLQKVRKVDREVATIILSKTGGQWKGNKLDGLGRAIV